MRSFRLYLGDRTYLAPAGWALLLAAVGVTTAVGSVCARWLADNVGPNELMIWIVAGTGAAVWAGGAVLCRALGYSLVNTLPPDAPPGPHPWSAR